MPRYPKDKIMMRIGPRAGPEEHMLFLLTEAPSQQPVQPYIEVRQRFERRINVRFGAGGDDRSDLLTRLRVGARADLGGGWTGEAQVQYSHGQAWLPGSRPVDDRPELNLGFVERVGPDGTLTLGRQKIAIANQRLVGPLEWVNIPRSFDGVRYRSGAWDAWGARLGVATVRPPDARLAGIGHKRGPSETHLILKTDRIADGTQEIVTLNHIERRELGVWRVTGEGAVQAGRNAGRDQRAWAGSINASTQVDPQGRVVVEANAASGGADEDTVRTFDNLYPTNHIHYGSMDLQGWRNMEHLSLGYERRLNPQMRASLTYHRFWLRDSRDAWYAASGAPNRGAGGAILRDPTGQSGRDVGQEIDLEFAWTPNRTTSVSAGIATFQPGAFVRRVNEGNDDRQVWGYVQYQSRF
jgi:hypothetical protein